MLAAVSTTPARTTAGIVIPIGPGPWSCPTTSATVAPTASGVAGDGVRMRTRSAVSSPLAVSTGAPLMPVPPTSTPTAAAVPEGSLGPIRPTLRGGERRVLDPRCNMHEQEHDQDVRPARRLRWAVHADRVVLRHGRADHRPDARPGDGRWLVLVQRQARRGFRRCEAGRRVPSPRAVRDR